jgi:1A family penicillin-binding protein
LRRGFISGVLAFVVMAAFALSAALIVYAVIAARLPSPAELVELASSFQSTRILDREGNLLYEAINPTDPNAGRRANVSLDRISPYLVSATVATEDANFYRHAGVDVVALVRALYYAVREGDLVSGGSTIPQQLVKRLFLSPERSVTRKIREAILATEISRTYEKDKILEMYLNEIYYGNLAYGVKAAALTYFGRDVAELTLAQAALLAGLPQLPAYYDPYTHPERAKERQAVVLGLMVEAGAINQSEADAAWGEPLNYAPLQYDMQSPHFTFFVLQQLEELLGSAAPLYENGLNVTTTLDPKLQQEAQRVVHDQIAQLGNHNVSNGALVAIRPQTGEIVALVGSADFNNVEIDGQVNMALAPRQPGSTIKPLVYLAALEQPNHPSAERWTPGTLVADIQEPFPDGANPPYVPTNYDGKERGLVTLRTALANSLNIPAVRAMQTVGLPAFLETAQRLGISTLTRPDYGLSLALGAGEIPLVEITGAFAVLANQGVRMPPIAILRITDNRGNVICAAGDAAKPCYRNPGAIGQPVVSAVDAFLISDILSDNEARTAVFGANSLLRLDRPAAAKTGTTNDFRDVLTLGYTPQLVTGVWVGNADNSEMRNISGITGAAPIWNEFMRFALTNEPIVEFTPPTGVKQFEVCADTGVLPSPACPERRLRWFAEDRPPLPPEKDLYQIVRLDKSNGKLATEFTPTEMIEEKVFKIYPEPYRAWAEEHGIAQPPADPSDVFDFAPEVQIRSPIEGEVVEGVVTVYGIANAPAFASYELQYGISHDPGAFSAPISGPFGNPIMDGELGQWDTRGLQEGPHTLRLVVRDTFGNEYDQRVRLFVRLPPPTPEVSNTPTWTPEALATPSETPTIVLLPTEIPTVTEAPTNTPEPTWSETPTTLPSETPLDVTDTPTWTPEPLPTETPTTEVSAPITSSAIITGMELITVTTEITGS